jgi:hypothetical protein
MNLEGGRDQIIQGLRSCGEGRFWTLSVVRSHWWVLSEEVLSYREQS